MYLETTYSFHVGAILTETYTNTAPEISDEIYRNGFKFKNNQSTIIGQKSSTKKLATRPAGIKSSHLSKFIYSHTSGNFIITNV